MEIYALIGFLLFGYSAYKTYQYNPSLFSSQNIDRSLLVFGVLILFLMLVIGLGVLAIGGI